MKRFLLFVGVFFLGLNALYAQTVLKGRILDKSTNEAVIGANVVLKGTTDGSISDLNGDFSFSTDETGSKVIEVSFIGYETMTKQVSLNGQTINLGTLMVSESSMALSPVEIIADVAIDRKTPVAVSTIKPAQLEEKLGTQEFPEILKSTPGIYATRSGGGFGDARVNIRGFNSVNVGVLINGMPVNDMENGKVYWSNWANLSDVARTIQVQRGLGASKLAIPSIGGTINVITKSTDAEKGGFATASIGSFGEQKQGVKFSTGLMDNGLAITVAATHRKGDGYVQGTNYEAYSYFLSVAKKINKNHELAFTAFGAPQEHGQRTTKLSLKEGVEHGEDYNKDHGYYKAGEFNSRINFYHKPVFIMNHYWTISPSTDLTTSAYASFGTGGGTGFLGEYSWIERDADGLIDFNKIAQKNADQGAAGSSLILRNSVNNHNWYGALSSLKTDLNNNLTLSGGIDLRYYKGEHYREVRDLLGNSYFLDDDDANNPIHYAQKGDRIDYYNDGIVLWEGLFGQLEYDRNKVSAFVSGALSNTSYKRIDYFNYLDSDDKQETDFQNFLGYSVKGGANYRLTDIHNIFVNAGYFSRAPFFDAVFLNYKNDINEGAENEKIASIELGYGLRTSKFSANINYYYTKWMDRSFVKRLTTDQGQDFTANLLGVDALHQGVEVDFAFKPNDKLELTGMASIGDWRWLNDLENVIAYDDQQNPSEPFSVYMADIKVGDAAQTTFAAGINYELVEGLKIGMDYNFYGDNFAEFNPTSRTNEDDRGVNSWQLENYSLVDANMSYKFTIGDVKASIFGNIHNIFDTMYVSDADETNVGDPANVFYGWGRSWSMGMKVNF
ncbi:outer membrane receptor for ferrienterochelin and colicin [Aureibacter tunicatorum]|uniref:Outer membrane receptor for ferrienterochelin and colicin n=2 Tax=Aureibacter tunicatorum TaxID=866807 RepID=A0AAE3XJR8_9BACT|nr:outer membrane receptor for ferrienterochelin and colicin [Aureibacter tunicatorum]